MDKIKFECKQCGLCCETLIKNSDGQRKGLALLPDETKLFPDDMVVPSMGLGKTLMNITKIIIYQLNSSKCPHLKEDKKCDIYNKRPISCRVFPLVWLGPQYGTVLAHPDDCKAVRDIEVYRGSLNGITFTTYTLEANTEWKYLKTKSKYIQEKMQKYHRRIYYLYSFNLATNQWELIS